jgi:hypothetical protein
MAPDDDDDPKVKALLDPSTEADLARWFNLPSFQQLAEQPRPEPQEIDEDRKAAIERRDRALAAVDPALLEALRVRHEVAPETLIQFEATIEVRVRENVSRVDEALVDKAMATAEPRTLEPPDELRDDMKDCTPQALLRDLHRAEIDFDKTFEIVDFAAEQRLDIVAEVKTAMATSWKLPALGSSPVIEGTAILAELRAERRRNWLDYLPQLDSRRVRE